MMVNQRVVVRIVAVASMGAAVFCLTQGATANTADYPIHVSGQWWGPQGATGALSARLAQDGDALTGFVSAPGNPDLDGVTVAGSAAQHALSLQAASRGAARGTISGQVYGDALFGTYLTNSGEAGSWMGSWSADPPRIADQWPPGAQLIESANVPDEPARLSSLAQKAFDEAQTTAGVAAAANGAPQVAGPLIARAHSGFGLGGLDDLVRGFGNWFEQGAGGGLAEAAVTVGANLLVNNPSDNSHPQNTPEVAIDRISNPNKIAVGANDRSFNQSTFKAGYYFSTDGGATWPAAGRGQVPGLSAYLNSVNASLTFDANGRVFYAGNAFNGATGSNQVFVARALSGNIAFENTIATVAFSANGNTEFEDKPWLAVNRNNGYVYVCWTKATNSQLNKQIWLARSTDNGENFTTTLAVSDDLNSSGCSVAVELDGTVDVAWIKSNNQIMFDRCTTSGTTLSCGTDVVLSRNASGQPVTFKACTNIPTGGVALTGNSNPTLAVDSGPGGNGYRAVVWCLDNNTIPPNLDTYFTLWNPNTSTWLMPKAIASVSNQQEFFPTITIDGNHFQQVLFYRMNPPSVPKFNAYITFSANGSGNFSPEVRVNDVGDIAATNQVNDGKGIGDYIGIDGSTTRQPAWMDSRGRTGVPPGTQQDIYTATASGC